MKIALVTPTGDRPQSLTRQKRYIRRSILPHEWEGHSPKETDAATWIVVDDGKEAFCPFSSGSMLGWNLEYIRRSPRNGEPTLIPNIITGLQAALKLKPEYILFWEDDDWYSPMRIADQVFALRSLGKEKGKHLHGSAPSVYYHIPLAVWREMRNNKYASLFETAISGKLLEPLLDFLQEMRGDGRGLDMKIWKRFSDYAVASGGRQSVGIKGLSGRAGIGVGHTPKDSNWNSDSKHEYLIELVGQEDASELLEEGGVK